MGDGSADEGDDKRSEKRNDQEGRTTGWGQFDSSSRWGWVAPRVSYGRQAHL
jgi:hypothetical protein